MSWRIVEYIFRRNPPRRYCMNCDGDCGSRMFHVREADGGPTLIHTICGKCVMGLDVIRDFYYIAEFSSHTIILNDLLMARQKMVMLGDIVPRLEKI